MEDTDSTMVNLDTLMIFNFYGAPIMKNAIPTPDYVKRKVFEAASAIIQNKGWNQGQLYANTGQVCALGALITGSCIVSGTEGEITPWEQHVMSEELLSIINQFSTDGKWFNIAQWNDDYSRSVEDVLLMLKLAAEQYPKEKHA